MTQPFAYVSQEGIEEHWKNVKRTASRLYNGMFGSARSVAFEAAHTPSTSSMQPAAVSILTTQRLGAYTLASIPPPDTAPHSVQVPLLWSPQRRQGQAHVCAHLANAAPAAAAAAAG